jgi:His-Xaa-Ser system radical SAM maturase HxsC
MIHLRAHAASTHLSEPLPRALWRIEHHPPDGGQDDALARNGAAVRVDPDAEAPAGFGLYLTNPGMPAADAPKPALELPPEMDYLSSGDVLRITPDGHDLRVLWRVTSAHNSILLTERCDNYCLMCSQPPRDRDDSWLLDEANELLGLLPATTPSLTFTGGEPTLYGQAFLDLLRGYTLHMPEAHVHILSNGRRFADQNFTAAYAQASTPNVMVAIPIYGAEPSLHDYIVQADGAFTETIAGIVNLAEYRQHVEIRVVLQKHTVPALIEIALFITRNLPFVDRVALMGLEPTGLARVNEEEVWIDPYDYRETLAEATHLLDSQRIPTLIYNHQHCVLDEYVRPFAVRSISDWKNDYDPRCDPCTVRTDCCGFFTTGNRRVSSHIHPIARVEV